MSRGKFNRVAAFAHGGNDVEPSQSGMTLRDYFAAHAPEPSEAWISVQRWIDRNRNPHNEPHKPAPRDDFQLIAEYKFAHADAMLKAREATS